MARPLRVLAVAILWIALGGWIGALTLFAAVVAPTSFRVLPSPEEAGRIVGPVLTALQLYGGAAGLGLAALGLALRRGRMAALLAVGLSLVCLYSQFGVTAEISEVRSAAFGSSPEAEAQQRFAELHRRSVMLFGATGVGAILLALLYARGEVSSRGDEA
jgi:hypothetical protein